MLHDKSYGRKARQNKKGRLIELIVRVRQASKALWCKHFRRKRIHEIPKQAQ